VAWGHFATVGLLDGPGLVVTPNDPSVARIDEQKASRNHAHFRVTGLKVGYSMLEAKDATGLVKAFMQIHVGGTGGKQIAVDLTSQTLEAFENGERKFQFDCVTGDEGHPTNRGTFHITVKHRIHRSTKYNVQIELCHVLHSGRKGHHQYHGSCRSQSYAVPNRTFQISSVRMDA